MNKKLKIGMIVGGAAAIIYALSNKECRENVCAQMSRTKECISDSVEFIRENREEIIEQVKSSVSDLSVVVKNISEDLKTLTTAVSSIKEDSLDAIEVTKEAASEIKRIK